MISTSYSQNFRSEPPLYQSLLHKKNVDLEDLLSVECKLKMKLSKMQSACFLSEEERSKIEEEAKKVEEIVKNLDVVFTQEQPNICERFFHFFSCLSFLKSSCRKRYEILESIIRLSGDLLNNTLIR